MLLNNPKRSLKLSQRRKDSRTAGMGWDGMDGWIYLSFVVDKGNAQIRHGSEDGHQRLDRIAVHHRPVLFEIIGRKSALVDNPNPCQK